MAGLAPDSFKHLMATVKGEGVVQVPVGMRSATIDEADADLVANHKWRMAGRYAVAGKSPNVIIMHRLLLNPAPGQIIDHIDGDGLNNQRYNLRLCSHAENMRNRTSTCGTSRFKGVYLSDGSWRAAIGFNGRKYRLGSFTTQAQAARAYDQAATELHGEFAKTNAELGLY